MESKEDNDEVLQEVKGALAVIYSCSPRDHGLILDKSEVSVLILGLVFITVLHFGEKYATYFSHLVHRTTLKKA